MKVPAVHLFLGAHESQKSRLEYVASEMRKADKLPKGGRGPHAPDIPIDKVMQLIVAHAGSNTVKNAAEVADKLLQFVDERGAKLGAYLLHILLTEHKLEQLDHILFIDETCVRFVWITKNTDEFFLPPDVTEDYSSENGKSPEGKTFVGRVGYVGGAALLAMMTYWAKIESGDEGESIGK